MRDIAMKPPSLRSATAEGRVRLSAEGLALIRDGAVAKGDVRECARIAGLMAVKRTPDWLPHCHPLPILDAGLDFTLEDDALRITARVRTIAATGVEMEALTAVSAAALTVYDMLKPHVPAEQLGIDGVRLLEKTGGKSDYAGRADGATAAVLVMSDTVAAGRKPDTAGKAVAEGLAEAGFTVVAYEVLADEPEQIAARAQHWLGESVALLVAVGGTGVGPRDCTVETLRPLIHAELPGLMETARQFGQQRTPYAMLSRGIAGLAGQNTVLMTLPGSRKGASESLAAVRDGLVHLIRACRWGQPHAGGYQ